MFCWLIITKTILTHNFQEADLAIAPITITKERQKVVDFTKPFMRTGLSLMIYKPEKRKPGMFSFKEPLHKNVWLCIAVGFLTTSVILFFIGRFSPFEWTQNSEEGPSSEFSMSNSLWSSLGALMQQGSDISPRLLLYTCIWKNMYWKKNQNSVFSKKLFLLDVKALMK